MACDYADGARDRRLVGDVHGRASGAKPVGRTGNQPAGQCDDRLLVSATADDGSQGLGAVHGAARAVDRHDDRVHLRIREGGLQITAKQLGGYATADVHEHVCALGDDAFDRQNGDTLVDGVGFGLVGQRLPDARLNGCKVCLLPAHMRQVDGLDLQQLAGLDGPGCGEDVQKFHVRLDSVTR